MVSRKPLLKKSVPICTLSKLKFIFKYILPFKYGKPSESGDYQGSYRHCCIWKSRCLGANLPARNIKLVSTRHPKILMRSSTEASTSHTHKMGGGVTQSTIFAKYRGKFFTNPLKWQYAMWLTPNVRANLLQWTWRYERLARLNAVTLLAINKN